MYIRKKITGIMSIILSGAIAISTLTVSAATKQSSSKIDDMISGMTTEEKISQLLMLELSCWEDDNGEASDLTSINAPITSLLNKYPIGGIILKESNCRKTADCTRLIYDFQTANAVNDNRSQLLIAADQEGGTVVRLGQGCHFCGNMALAATGNPEYTEGAADIIGSELSIVGINIDLAPVVDINNNPANPIIGVRSFADEPTTVTEQALRYMNGLKKNNVATTLKHFPGHGNTDTDSHTGLPKIDLSYDELKKNELVPFNAAISNGTDLIMTAHIEYPEIEKQTYTSKETGEKIFLPATLSKTIITDILRKDMGFDGVVITDAMLMDAVNKHFDRLDAAKLAINAGVDILLAPVTISSEKGIEDLESYIASLTQMAENGDISMDNINSSVKRILKLKETHNILDKYNVKNIDSRIAAAAATVGSSKNHEKEMEITKKSITLLKNDNNTLPIKADGKKTVILTAYADELMSMEYAVNLLKDSGKMDKNAEVRIDTYKNMSEEEAIKFTDGADNVILITEMYGIDYINPDTNSGKNSTKVKNIISAVHKNKGKVTAISCFLPYDTAYFQDADAILTAWTMKGMNEDPRVKDTGIAAYGPSMPAAAYLAFESGEDVSGSLPINIPVINDNHTYSNETLYERGYGLTYADTMIYGDSDKDGKVTVRDSALIARMLAKTVKSLLPICSDHNRDGIIDVRDAAGIASDLSKNQNK